MRNMKFAIAGSVVMLAVAYLVLTGMQSTAVYYLTVGELKARGEGAVGRPVRVAGPGGSTFSAPFSRL